MTPTIKVFVFFKNFTRYVETPKSKHLKRVEAGGRGEK
jgi:hypothetical protein